MSADSFLRLPAVLDRTGSSGLVQVIRTEEEIQAQLDARLQQLEREHGRINPARTCVRCQYGIPSKMGLRYTKCRNPLIIGFAKNHVWAWDCQDGSHGESALCGPEKALWQPHPSPWRRLLTWLTGE